ncbi:MAG: hypothetical protein WC201_03180 [Bacilli bacterium]
MIYKSTDPEAFEKAGVEKTKRKRSKAYHKYKKENQLKPKKNENFFVNDVKTVIKEMFFGLVGSKNNNADFPQIRNNKHFKSSIKKSNYSSEKYVPKRLILDDIRDFRSSKIISNISNGFATFLVKIGKIKNMSNNQMNILRSAIAFVTSETINKALEKPLKVIDNIKMFVKVGKIIYKVLMFFDDITNEYTFDGKNVSTVQIDDFEYIEYLNSHPKIKEYEYKNDLIDLLGKEVVIVVDRPLGSIHPIHKEVIYQVNYGYLVDAISIDGEKQYAYILGVNEPIKEYKGIVKAIIYNKNECKNNLIVCSNEQSFSKEEIKKKTFFQEQFFDTEIILLNDELNLK